MIPKIIHYCWLSGDPYPPLVLHCIESWKKKLPDYEIILWDKDRIDINSILWLKQAYECKKYAFAADYIRFYALYNYGGIYLDADVEVIKSFNPLLDYKEFVGEDASGDIEAAVIGAEKNAPWLKECLEYYKDRPFVKANGTLDMKPVPLLVRRVLSKYSEIKIYPFQYFSPKDYNVKKIFITNDTYCVHHFDGKWIKRGIKYSLKITVHKILYLFFGREIHNSIVHIIRKITKRGIY